MASDHRNGGELRAESLECLRGDRLLFTALNLRVRPGEVLQVEGPNGAGKTSLLRMLAGLTLPEAGEIYWNGRPIRRQRGTYAVAVHYVGHQNALKDGLTIAENLRFSSGLMGGGNLDSAMQRLGIYPQRRQHVHTLSAGQRRRSALARLLLRPAPLWILDEPYTALDPAGTRAVDDLIASHAGTGGTVILTSHQRLDLPGLVPQRLRIGT